MHLDPLELELQAVGSCLRCGCWEPNLGPLEEQCTLLTTEPSPQPPWVLCVLRVQCVADQLCPSVTLPSAAGTQGFKWIPLQTLILSLDVLEAGHHRLQTEP